MQTVHVVAMETLVGTPDDEEDSTWGSHWYDGIPLISFIILSCMPCNFSPASSLSAPPVFLAMATGKQISASGKCCSLLAITHAAPSGDETLTPDDAVNVLEELLPAQIHSYVLGLKLGLSPHVVDSIHERHAEPRDRLLHVLIAFTEQTQPRPTWRVIADTLRNPVVKLPYLADNVKAAHFPDTTATRDVPPQSIGISCVLTSKRQNVSFNAAPPVTPDLQTPSESTYFSLSLPPSRDNPRDLSVCTKAQLSYDGMQKYGKSHQF